MSYPIYRQDFENNTTIPPELTNYGNHTIDSGGLYSFTGNRSVKLPIVGTQAGNSLLTKNYDTVSGNFTLTTYFNTSSGTTNNARLSAFSLYGRSDIANTGLFSSYRCTFVNGLLLAKFASGVSTNLTSALAGNSVIVTGVWHSLELRIAGSSITANVVRQDTGQFFNPANSGWTSVATNARAYDTSVTGSGRYGIRITADTSDVYTDDIILDPSTPSVDFTSFTISSTGSVQQLTAGGFTDPLFGTNWFSSNLSIATVSSGGLVTPINNGTVTITASGKRDVSQFSSSTGVITGFNQPIGNGNLFSTVGTFNSGLVNSVKYSVFQFDGSTFINQTNSGVRAIGNHAYGTNFIGSATGSYLVEWFDGTNTYSYDQKNPVNAIVFGYNGSQDPGSYVLSNNQNKLSTDAAGGVLLQLSQTGVVIPTVTTVTGLSGTINSNVISISGVPVIGADINGAIIANVLYMNSSPVFGYDGTIASATANTITFPTTDSVGNAIPDDNRFQYSVIQTVRGVGVGQNILTTTKNDVRTFNILDNTMPVQVDSTTQYILLGTWQAQVSGISAIAAITGIVNANVVSFSGISIKSTPDVFAVNSTTISGTVDANVISFSGVPVSAPNISGAILADIRYIQQSLAILFDGTAQAGGSNYITLAANESSIDNFHKDKHISLVGGSGVGQFALIGSYNGTTKQAFISQPVNWYTIPDNTTQYSFGGFGINNLNLNQAIPPTGNIVESVSDCLMGGRTQAFGGFTLTQVSTTGYTLTLTTAGGFTAKSFAMPADFVNNLVPTRRY